MTIQMLLLLAVSGLCQYLQPPYAAWAHSYWVWLAAEDSNQTAQEQLIERYAQLNITVGCINIDSGWSTGFNNFQWNRTKFPNPEGLIQKAHSRGIKVIVWATSMVNKESSNYEEGKAKGYLLNNGSLVKWWHGEGAFLDYTKKEALDWWHKQLDTPLDMGVDGFKVDGSDPILLLLKYPHSTGSLKPVTYREYADLYYRDFFQYANLKRMGEALIMARPVDSQAIPLYNRYAPRDVMFSGWVGDQDSSFYGMRRALNNMFHSAWENYTNFGSDIGGYRKNPAKRDREVMARWLEMGTFVPLMQNGGNGPHHPWQFDKQVQDIFTYYCSLRTKIIPFLYTTGVKSYLAGVSSIQPLRHQVGTLDATLPTSFQFVLGNAILVSPVTDFCDCCVVTHKIPKGVWVDHWNNSKSFIGPGTVRRESCLDRTPIYYKAGSIIPITGGLLLVPGLGSGVKERFYYDGMQVQCTWDITNDKAVINYRTWHKQRVEQERHTLKMQVLGAKQVQEMKELGQGGEQRVILRWEKKAGEQALAD